MPKTRTTRRHLSTATPDDDTGLSQICLLRSPQNKKSNMLMSCACQDSAGINGTIDRRRIQTSRHRGSEIVVFRGSPFNDTVSSNGWSNHGNFSTSSAVRSQVFVLRLIMLAAQRKDPTMGLLSHPRLVPLPPRMWGEVAATAMVGLEGGRRVISCGDGVMSPQVRTARSGKSTTHMMGGRRPDEALVCGAGQASRKVDYVLSRVDAGPTLAHALRGRTFGSLSSEARAASSGPHLRFSLGFCKGSRHPR